MQSKQSLHWIRCCQNFPFKSSSPKCLWSQRIRAFQAFKNEIIFSWGSLTDFHWIEQVWPYGMGNMRGSSFKNLLHSSYNTCFIMKPKRKWNCIVQLRKTTAWAWRKSTECPEYIAWLLLEHGRNVEAPSRDVILNCTMCVTLEKGIKSQLCQFTHWHCHVYVSRKKLALAALHWHWSEI